MLRISSTDHPPATPTFHQGWPLFSTLATRQIEQDALRQLPPHTLMQRAGLAVAQLAMALAPHAQRIWIACGSGNNGGDGLEAAAQLKARLPHTAIRVSQVGEYAKLPADAQAAWARAKQAGVQWVEECPHDLSPLDLCIDALLGIGVTSKSTDKPREINPRLLHLLEQTRQCVCPVLCVDIASGLDADSGQYLTAFPPSSDATLSPRHTLALLTLQPGHFTAQGRDACGQIWWDDLGCGLTSSTDAFTPSPIAHLTTTASLESRAHLHASHKGSFGDVAVLGGEGLSHRGLSMTGAAWLAALAALHAGAGRVMLALLDASHTQGIAPWPEIMLRQPQAQDWSSATVVCGCGGGQAIQDWLPQVLQQAPRLVLDADALNAIADSPSLAEALTARANRQQATILTPHPLEAARLLRTSTSEVQSQRLQACLQLAQQFQCTALLKGSGTIVANANGQIWINSSGNARLATGGTGDVLAGLIGALWAQGRSADQSAVQAALRHGQAADLWPSNHPFSASALAQHLSC